MDDADVLGAVRECDRATTERIAKRLSVPVCAARERLAALEDDGRVEREGGEDGEAEWTVARDPRIGESVERLTDRLGRERDRHERR